MWQPSNTDFRVEQDKGGKWAVLPVSDKARLVCRDNTVREFYITPETLNDFLAILREMYDCVVWDPQEFYRTARPITGVSITDNFSKD